MSDLLGFGAMFSPCRTYRYTLWRIWSEVEPVVAFVGLNPSTADESVDDPTIRRCIGFAESWGYGGLVMLNLFAYRATDPNVMKRVADPVGPDNDGYLCSQSNMCGRIIAAWGVHGLHRGRANRVRLMIDNLHHLGLTKGGHPKHPLYLRGDTKPTPWNLKEIANA